MDLAAGAQAFQTLARRLKETGEEGLRRELIKAIHDAGKPIAAEIKNPGHLRAYMPTRYAGVLSLDLRVTTTARTTGTSPGVTILARAPTIGRGGRKIRQRNDGVITHPVFARGPRRSWDWKVQTDGMKAGFFTDPARSSAPQVREAVLEAMRHIADEITKRT